MKVIWIVAVILAVSAIVMVSLTFGRTEVCKLNDNEYKEISYSSDNQYLAALQGYNLCIFENSKLVTNKANIRSFSWSSRPGILFASYANSNGTEIIGFNIDNDSAWVVLLLGNITYELDQDNLILYQSNSMENINLLNNAKTNLPYYEFATYIPAANYLALKVEGNLSVYKLPEGNVIFQTNKSGDLPYYRGHFISINNTFMEVYFPDSWDDKRLLINSYDVGQNKTSSVSIAADLSELSHSYHALSLASDDGRYLAIGSSYGIGATCEGAPPGYVCGGASVVIFDFEKRSIIYRQKWEKNKYNQVAIAWWHNSHKLSYLFDSEPLSELKTVDFDAK